MTDRFEEGLEVLFCDEPAEAGDVYLAVVRIAVCAFLPSFGIRYQHRHLVAFLHVRPVQFQSRFGR